MTPKEPKTERDCSHRQLFRPLWGSSVWRNDQRSGSDGKISDNDNDDGDGDDDDDDDTGNDNDNDKK